MSGKKIISNVKKGYFWTNEDKSRAVAAYVATGSFTKSASITGIHENTIRNWAKQDWFGEEARRVDQTDSDELKSTFTRIAKKASIELEDRLEKGDEVFNNKTGELQTRKIAGKDLAIIAAVAIDKRKQQLDIPQTFAVQSSQEKLLSLMQAFIKFQGAKEIKQEKDYNVREAIEVVQESIQPDQGYSGSSVTYDPSIPSTNTGLWSEVPTAGKAGTTVVLGDSSPGLP